MLTRSQAGRWPGRGAVARFDRAWKPCRGQGSTSAAALRPILRRRRRRRRRLRVPPPPPPGPRTEPRFPADTPQTRMRARGPAACRAASRRRRHDACAAAAPQRRTVTARSTQAHYAARRAADDAGRREAPRAPRAPPGFRKSLC